MIVTAIIPARGGSKRLKSKNIHPIWNMPMIYWAINACKESNYSIDTWVTTDSEEIARIAESFDAKIVIRDETTSNDLAYKQEAIRDAARKIDSIKGTSDIYISLQANSPEIRGEHLDMGIKSLLDRKKDEIISADSNFMQNGAFRVFRGNYVYQKDLSTNCGFVICDLYDVHSLEDVKFLETRGPISSIGSLI